MDSGNPFPESSGVSCAVRSLMTQRLITGFIGASALIGALTMSASQDDRLKALAREALSRLEGAVSLAGLRAPVEVIRDRWGVPHISAQNTDDLFFAQGFVAAQDR